MVLAPRQCFFAVFVQKMIWLFLFIPRAHLIWPISLYVFLKLKEIKQKITGGTTKDSGGFIFLVEEAPLEEVCD